MHNHTHQCNNTGEQRISTVPASIKSLPHMSFLDNHSSCIVGKYGEAMEAVHQTYGQNMTAIELFPMEAFSLNSPVLNIGDRTQQFK